MGNNKCVFLDRDGVINVERGDYTYRVEDFEIIKGVHEALNSLKGDEYFLVIITNQAGISRKLFTVQQMDTCHAYLHEQTHHCIDAIYYSPWHPTVSESLARKPGSLMFERGMAKYDIDPLKSWMVGNSEKDLIPARQLGMRTIFIGREDSGVLADFYCEGLGEAANIILEVNNELLNLGES